MNSPAAWLAAPLVAGVVVGALVRQPPAPFLIVAGAGWLVATYAFTCRRGWMLVVAVMTSVMAAGAIVGARAAAAAAAPSLLLWQRSQPTDTVAHITGVIRDDAGPAGYGTGLTLDVTHLSWSSGEADVRGGVRLTIAGAMAPSRASSWTAGRRISCDAVLANRSTITTPASRATGHGSREAGWSCSAPSRARCW